MAKATTFRQNISLSVDLKRRMDKAGAEINWSAVAAQAFEVKLAEIAAKKEKKNMQDVIQRLRGLKAKSPDETYTKGEKLGAAWARDLATPSQLDRLSEAKDLLEVSLGLLPVDSAFGNAERLAFVFLGKGDQTRQGAMEFWAALDINVKRDKADSEQFLRGFVDGAREIWDAVKDEV